MNKIKIPNKHKTKQSNIFQNNITSKNLHIFAFNEQRKWMRAETIPEPQLKRNEFTH